MPMAATCSSTSTGKKSRLWSIGLWRIKKKTCNRTNGNTAHWDHLKQQKNWPAERNWVPLLLKLMSLTACLWP